MERGQRLSDTAMLIYVYVKSHSKDDIQLRDIQRAMGFSSPSSALFHLQKLETAGLLLKDSVGFYRVKTSIRVNLVRNFVIMRGVFVPRHMLYAIVMTIALILFSVALIEFLSSPITVVALLLNAASAGLFWYEAWQDWKLKPRFPDHRIAHRV
jgi:hypothetical protein